MCGLVAVYSPRQPLDGTCLERPLAALRHRGPDATGAWVSPDGVAALGHARLAVIDLAGGRQPLAGTDPRTQVVVTGEFYGYEAVREELLARGCRLRTASDSEIAAHLHELHGEAALAQLRGEFAFVLWDGAQGRLLAVRDRFGVKPLFYSWHGGRLLIASEVKALLACGVAARWDLDAFADHLQLGLPADRTLFAGVRQVPPGCYLAADHDGARVRSWWDLDFPGAVDATDAGATGPSPEQLLDALREAVTVRLRADVPVGCHLSGGVDSTTVLALAAPTAPVAAYTVTFDDPAFDEGPAARATAAALGVEQLEIPCQRQRYADVLAPALRAGETIQENAHGIARYLHSAAIKASGRKVVLAGEGGDELFAAYPQLRRDLELTVSPEARRRAGEGYAKLAATGMPPHLHSLLEAVGIVPSWVLERYMRVTVPVRDLLRRDVTERLDRRDGAAATLEASAAQRRDRTPFHQSLYLFYRTWFCNYILAAERLDMAHGVEVRLPLLDHRLFELVRHAPLAWYAPAGRPKQPLLDAMAGRLPGDVASARKRPFFAPPVAGDPAALAELRRLASGEALEAAQIFDTERVRALVERTARQDAALQAGNERALHVVASVAVLTETFAMAPAA